LLGIAALITLPSSTLAQQSVTENFIFVNYIGQEVILDVDDVTYVVPGTNIFPDGGRFTLALDPGQHKFAANVPGKSIGSGGEFTLAAGETVAKGARIEKTGPVLDPEGIVLEKPKDKVVVFDFDPFALPVDTPVVTDTWQPLPAAPGQGSLAWNNFWGRDELTLDLNGTLYQVPPATDTLPGRLQLDVDPGFYRYTVSVPNGSLNGEVAVVAGQVIGLNVSADPLPEPVYEIGEKNPLPLPVTLRLFEENLTAVAQQPAAVADQAPLTLPNTGEVLPLVVEPIQPVEEGLLVKNYAGGSLVFTIDNQTFVIDDHAEQRLPLTPGRYSYTASLPFVATTGIVDLLAAPTAELSIVLDVNRDFLTVYIE
ncbi:MAG: hypothetical protein R3264_08515, partial [Anaerolineae bacterium]|nr:hypothetical protein [Anaerolineae bacterium]